MALVRAEAAGADLGASLPHDQADSCTETSAGFDAINHSKLAGTRSKNQLQLAG